jgi:hypothetical protein
MDDAFEDWHEDEFPLAFVNGRAAVVAACPDAEQARAQAFELVKALADRLIRYDSRLASLAARGLFTTARVDLVAVGRPNAE